MDKTLVISVVGFGRVGQHVTYLLSHTAHVDMIINVMDPDDSLEGSFLDILHTTVAHNFELDWNNEELFAASDYVFHCAGPSVLPGATRMSIATESIDLTNTIFEGVKWEGEPFVIVLANPVDVLCKYVKLAAGLPAHKVIGTGTLLDSWRLDTLLCDELDLPSDAVFSWVLGEHGESMVPVWSQSLVDGQNAADWLSDEKKQRIHEELKSMAAKIKATQGATYYGVARAALEIFEALEGFGGGVEVASVNVNAHYQQRLGCADIFLSLPVQIEDGEILIVNDYLLTEEELTALRASAQRIEAHS